MKQDHSASWLFITAFIICFGFIGWVTYEALKMHEMNIVSQCCTAVIGILTLIAGYQWGSSKSSKDKTEQIERMAAIPPNTTTSATIQTVTTTDPITPTKTDPNDNASATDTTNG